VNKVKTAKGSQANNIAANFKSMPP